MKNGLLCFAVALLCVLATPTAQAEPIDGSTFSLNEFLWSLFELFDGSTQAEAAPSNTAVPEHAPFLPPGGAPDEENRSSVPPATNLNEESLEHAPFWPPGG